MLINIEKTLPGVC